MIIRNDAGNLFPLIYETKNPC